jgi:hypothetical protein
MISGDNRMKIALHIKVRKLILEMWMISRYLDGVPRVSYYRPAGLLYVINKCSLEIGLRSGFLPAPESYGSAQDMPHTLLMRFQTDEIRSSRNFQKSKLRCETELQVICVSTPFPVC